MTPTDRRILAALRASPAGLTTSEVIRAVDMASNYASARLHVLLREGHVKRAPVKEGGKRSKFVAVEKPEAARSV